MVPRTLSDFWRLLAWIGIGFCVLVSVAWISLYVVGIGYGVYKTWGHQAFAKNGVAQIGPAWQMDQLYDDCRHSIVHSGRDSVSTWNAVAFFGGRYKLTMQVPVEIESSRRGRMIGEPTFHLLEVSRADVSPRVSASYSNQLVFGPAEWQRVYKANGDFSQIGYKLKTGPPVKNFKAYVRAVQ